jgi:hypothetical protein
MIKIYSKGFFKHSGQIHIIPAVTIVIEPLKFVTLLTFDIIFLAWTAYVSFFIKR